MTEPILTIEQVLALQLAMEPRTIDNGPLMEPITVRSLLKPEEAKALCISHEALRTKLAECRATRLTQYRVVPGEEYADTHKHPWHSPQCYEQHSARNEDDCTCGLTALRQELNAARNRISALEEELIALEEELTTVG